MLRRGLDAAAGASASGAGGGPAGTDATTSTMTMSSGMVLEPPKPGQKTINRAKATWTPIEPTTNGESVESRNGMRTTRRAALTASPRRPRGAR